MGSINNHNPTILQVYITCNKETDGGHVFTFDRTYCDKENRIISLGGLEI